MKKILLSLFLVAALLAGCTSSFLADNEVPASTDANNVDNEAVDGELYEVTRVVDGDTIEIYYYAKRKRCD